MSMQTPEERYRSDPHYKMLVDSLEATLHHVHYAPSELREIAMLACVHYELRNPAPFFIMRGGEVMPLRSAVDAGEPPNIVIVSGIPYRRMNEREIG